MYFYYQESRTEHLLQIISNYFFYSAFQQNFAFYVVY